MFIYYQYFYGNAQFSKACVNGALIKKKNNLQHNRNKNSTVVYQVWDAQFGKDLKCLFRSDLTINTMLVPQVQEKRVPDLGSAEHEGALELSCPG